MRPSKPFLIQIKPAFLLSENYVANEPLLFYCGNNGAIADYPLMKIKEVRAFARANAQKASVGAISGHIVLSGVSIYGGSVDINFDTQKATALDMLFSPQSVGLLSYFVELADNNPSTKYAGSVADDPIKYDVIVELLGEYIDM